MVFYGTNNIECINFHVAGDSKTHHFIMMTKLSDAPIFTVECSWDSEWCYDFWMENNSDYERVKYNIMETIGECEDVDVLQTVLEKIFEDGFEEILVECDCDGNCENCDCK